MLSETIGFLHTLLLSLGRSEIPISASRGITIHPVISALSDALPRHGTFDVSYHLFAPTFMARALRKPELEGSM